MSDDESWMRRVMPMFKTLLLVLLLISATACGGNTATAPSDSMTQTVTATLSAETPKVEPFIYSASYPVSLTAPGVVTVTVTNITPAPSSNLYSGIVEFWIGVVPAFGSGCERDDLLADVSLVSPSGCPTCPSSTSATIPVQLHRAYLTAVTFCVGVANFSFTTETYTLTIVTANSTGS